MNIDEPSNKEGKNITARQFVEKWSKIIASMEDPWASSVVPNFQKDSLEVINSYERRYAEITYREDMGK